MKGNKFSGRFVVVALFFDLSVDAEVADGLLSEKPAELLENDSLNSVYANASPTGSGSLAIIYLR